MIPWSDIPIFMRVLIVTLFVTMFYRIVLAPQSWPYDWALIVLFFTVWGYLFFGLHGAKHRREEMLEHAKQIQPVLAEDAVFVSPDELPPGEEFGIYDIETGDGLGNLSRDQLRDLIRFYEQGGLETNDFFVLHGTPEFMADEGEHPALVARLKEWLNDRDSAELRWSTKTVD